MPELYAALTDLLPPDVDAAGDLPRLPIAERLLSRAERRPAPADWRRWLLGHAGLAPAAGDLPVARTLAAQSGLALADGTSWLVATPVHLVAGMTRLQFHAQGALTLAPGAGARLAERFAQDWRDPSLALVPAGGQLLLRSAARYEVVTTDPAAHAGREVREALPTGADAGRLERLMTELQMWLHRDPPASVEGPAVNALWLWGGGHGPLAGSATWPQTGSRDAFLAAAAAVVPGALGTDRFEDFSLAALARAGRAFADCDALWFGPVDAALRSGAIGGARIHAAAQEFVLRPSQRWRGWVRPRPWWELLR